MIDDISMKIRADELIRMALAEDVTSEDVSTSSVLPAPAEGEADLLCKQSGVVAGLPVFARVFELLGGVRVTLLAKDGDRVERGQKLASLRGDMRAILTGERTALNFLQRMSGIATYTAKMAALLAGSGLKLVDTRKTTPNMRLFCARRSRAPRRTRPSPPRSRWRRRASPWPSRRSRRAQTSSCSTT